MIRMDESEKCDLKFFKQKKKEKKKSKKSKKDGSRIVGGKGHDYSMPWMVTPIFKLSELFSNV